MITVTEVRSRSDLRAFLHLPWRVYRGDRNWVPPLLSEIRSALALPSRRRFRDAASRARLQAPVVERSEAGSREPTQVAFIARDNGEPAGRLFAAFDPALNERKQITAGHLSLFEATNDNAVAHALFERAFAWLRNRGVTLVRGPVCPAGPAIDETKGLLVDGFDHRPLVLTSYNPPYYQCLFERAGFEKDADVFAYHLDATRLFSRNPGKAVDYAARRYGFQVAGMNLADVEGEVHAIKHVLDLAVPAGWPDMVAPSLDEVRAMARRLVPLVDPDITAIVRAGDEPVGFGLAIPDYNQVLAHLNGRITPLGALKYFWYKRRITRARIFVMFVVPAFRQKGVAHAIYYRIFDRGTSKGYTHGEASTIGETNRQMRADIEKLGGEKYKTFRVYAKEI